jgi:hypothetical protein
MNIKTVKNKTLGIFLCLALVLSLLAVALPATPVKATATAATITSVAGPVLSNPAYVAQGGNITVSGTVTDNGADGNPCNFNMRVEVYNATTTITDTTLVRNLTCDTTPQTFAPLTVAISPTAAAGTYNVRLTAQNQSGGGPIIVTNLSSIIVDNTLPTVALINPNGGNFIASDADYTVRWNATDTVPPGNFQTVSALYNLDGSTTFPPGNVVFAPASNVPKGENTATWAAAAIPEVDISTCKLQLTVIDAAGNSKSVASATNFTIISTYPTVASITAPSAATSWNGGTSQNIIFSATSALNLNVDYKIEFYNPDTTSWSNISTGDGWVLNKAVTAPITQAWTVNNAYRGTAAQIRITVRDKAGHLSSTVASPQFTIIDVTKPTVTITSPVAGVKYYSGQTYTSSTTPPGIAFTATDNAPGSLTYYWYFSYNGGSTWTQLGTSTQAQGTINKDFTPSVLTSSTNCKIKVTATDLAQPIPNISADAVSGVFSVIVGVNPTVTVTDPNAAGISMQVGNAYTIKWTASDTADTTAKLTYTIELSTNGGTSYLSPPIAVLTNQPQGARTFSWSVSDNPSANCKIKVTATNAGSTLSGNDASDNNFTITPADFGVVTASIPLVYSGSNGWNLISLPLIPTNTSIENILGPIVDNVVVVWYYSGGASGTWSSYVPGVSGTTPAFLTKMEDGKAYLIKVKQNCNLTFQGRTGPVLTSAPPVYSYVAGWNLVGFKSTDAIGTLTVTEYLTGMTFHDPIMSFDNSGKVWTSVAGGANMTPDDGYWVYFIAAGTVTPPLDQ